MTRTDNNNDEDDLLLNDNHHQLYANALMNNNASVNPFLTGDVLLDNGRSERDYFD